MDELNFRKMRVAFQGEAGAFSEAAAVQLLGEEIGLGFPGGSQVAFYATFFASTGMRCEV